MLKEFKNNPDSLKDKYELDGEELIKKRPEGGFETIINEEDICERLRTEWYTDPTCPTCSSLFPKEQL